MKKIEATLLLLFDGDFIMLAKKKRGFGKEKYNGVGGKIEPGETSIQAMKRECFEEVGVTPIEYQKRGEMFFTEYKDGEKVAMAFDLYTGTKWEGEITESDEMCPHWFKKTEIPYEHMFEDDKYWLPYVLEGKNVKVFFDFDEDWNIISKSVETY